MKLRHIRTAAISGIALVALAGTSGCGGQSAEQDSGSAATPAADTATSADAAREALREVKVSDCAYAGKQGVTAQLSATNSSATATYSYKVTVKFTAPDGTALATQTPSMPFVRPGRTDTLDIATPYAPKAGASTGGVKCEVAGVERTTG
ncbi:hypothetical protein BLA24_23815 [Streptomyces cinnamoneus]|uniref:Secreted protein n=1 Tax=Streptomyces cinnamoneus TaxID=53446 RepID=A0A2G1XD74_STRCJ|nr:hypothetical protein [Streptomyces cinnamoneus]PHQ49109.1 hypothetical protein BLA24_23815 [Streptomyces cinnamoneus]PPT15243.1 hypothetical protein CYQ11_22255 [Streptomyces cinnamoneus]